MTPVRYLDVSMPLFEGMPTFPGDPVVEVRKVRARSRGDAFDLSRLALGSHTGTHVDPPSHFIPGGATIDRIDLRALQGPCRVVEVGGAATDVGPEAVAAIPRGTRRVLFRTSNSERWRRSLEPLDRPIGLSLPAAEELVGRGIAVVGIDALSVDSARARGFPVHRELLGHGVLLIEGLLLGEAPAGTYDLACLPLRLRDGDGAPARALLRGR